jgi:ABC-type nitrate/sulfonate/bicarbonate transport system permease component
VTAGRWDARWIAARWRGLVLPVALLSAGEVAARATHFRSDAVAMPSEVAVAWWHALLNGSLGVATAETLTAATLAVALGFSLALAGGALLALSVKADRIAEIPVDLLRTVPTVALIPIALMIFGFGYRMDVTIAAVAVFWPCLILCRGAILGVEPRLFDVSRNFGLSHREKFQKILIPAIVPRLFLALRQAVAIALIICITVEITSNTIGLGYGMMSAQQTLRPDLMLAYLLWIGVLGFVVNAALLRLQLRIYGHVAATEPPA